MRKMGITIGILLLLIGGTYAEDNIPSVVAEDNISNIIAEDNTSIAREDFAHRLSNDTNTSTNYVGNVTTTVDKDTNGPSMKEDTKEDIAFGDTETIPVEKKSSPGFGIAITMIVFLSLVVIMIRRI